MENSTNTQKAVKGISSQTLVTIILGILEVVTFSIMSRLLSKEDFGYYAAISAVVVVFASFSDTGIGAAIIQRKQLDKRYIDNAFTLSLILGAIVMFVLLILSGTISLLVADNSMQTPLMLMSITLLLNCLISVNVSVMYRNLQFIKVGIVHIVSLVLTSVVAIVLAFYGYGYYAILTKAIMTSICTFILSLMLCRTHYSLRLDMQTSKSIFSFSGWLMASVIFRNFAQQVDRLMMPNLLSVSALGAYNRPKDFVNQISSKINSIFDIALFPVLSTVQNDILRLSNAFRRSFFLLNLFSALLAFGFIFNSDLIIRLFFGEEWLYLRNIFCVFSVAVIFNVDGRLADCYLRSMALTRQQFYFRVIETVLKVMMVLIGSIWGMIGIAISIVAADATMKMFKVSYVAFRINIGFKMLFLDFIYSLRFLILLLPINFFAVKIFPRTLQGCLIVLMVFMISTILIFFGTPTFVGDRYKDEVWTKVIGFFNRNSIIC